MVKQSTTKSVNRLIKPFAGLWVALSSDDREVIAVGKNFQAVLNKAHKQGESCPHLLKSPDSSTAAFIF